MKFAFLKFVFAAITMAGILGAPRVNEACPGRGVTRGVYATYQVVETRPVATSGVVLATSTRHETTTVVQAPNPEPDLPLVIPGSTITLFANFLGKEPGFVVVELNGTTIQADILRWEPNQVQVKLPAIGVVGVAEGRISVLLPTGQIGHSLRVNLRNIIGVRTDHDGLPDAKPAASGTAAPASRVESPRTELMIPSSLQLRIATP
jgi:hypothetical protein